MTVATPPPRGRRPLSWLRAAAALVLAAALLAGCQQRPSFRIGYLEGQPDSALMAHMVAETLRRAGARSVLSACRTPVACGHQLQAGDLDLLPEYSGTARVFFQSAEIAGGALPSVRRALADAGLAATPALGFEAPYKLLMRRAQAAEFEIDSIEGLSELDRPRFAVPPGYARQPGDGLFPLARRYGLEIAPEQVAELRAPAERIARLLAGEVEVAVVRAPFLRQPSVTALKDTLNFYPRYEASVVLGSETVQHQRFVERALNPLFGNVTAEVVQPLLIEQVLHGRDPAPLASRLLVRLGVLDATGPSVRRPEMTVVHGVGEELGELGGQALLTVRRTFPERPVNVIRRSDPASALETGAADLAIVHTSDFFRLDWSGSYAGRDPRLEAIAPVGRRPFLMVLRAETAQAPGSPLSARVGVQPGWTAGGRVAARMLSLAGQRPHRRAASGQLVADVKAGDLDAAILLLDQGARAALQGLSGNRVQVSGLSRWLPAPPFFLNEQRLPAKAVPGALTPVDTLSMQLLLAAPSPRGRSGALHGGPASAVATGGLPLPLNEAKALAAASEAAEPLEPVLPTFRERAATAERARNGPTAWLETALVLAALVYLAWAGRLLLRRNRPPV
jgi:glycine betaine/choline ABC-type transport system substrate-binding protein